MHFRLIYLFSCLIIFSTASLLAKGNDSDTLRIIPKPSQIVITGKSISLAQKWRVYIDSHANMNKEYIASLLRESGIDAHFTVKRRKANLLLLIDKEISKNFEAYHLQVSKNKKIIASAIAKNGLLYAVHTLRQIVSSEDNKNLVVPSCEITDEPAFSWRAFMLDESRHFHGKEVVKQLLDEMARLKMNTFHWHLVDDPGWRIQIKKYPLLTEIGAKGNYSLMSKGITPLQWDSLYHKKASWYYTQNEIREIVQYANDRGIRIIPEIEVPGHVTASLYAYPWLGTSSRERGEVVPGDLYNITDSKVETFLHDVLDEVMALFPSKVVHIGGDEANYTHWDSSKAVQSFMKENHIPTSADLQVWAINRMSNYISSKGGRMIGWNEITGDNVRNEANRQASKSQQLASGTIVQFWDGDVSLINKAIAQGYDVVNSNRFFTYVDYPYETTSLEKAYSFNPIPAGIQRRDQSKILGLGCQMWGEHTPDTRQLYDHIFPRIAAYAECGWVNPEKKTSYADFRKRMLPLEIIWKDLGFLKNQIGKY